jgi:hypothetical protein
MRYRQIFTDGRPFPQDPDPTWNGYSVGHWDGDTLVVGNPIHPSFTGRLVALPLKEVSAVTELHVIWRRDEQAKATLDFVQFTRDALGDKESLMPG